MTRILPSRVYSYDDAVRWIYERIDYERIPPVRASPHFQLDRVRRLLALIDSPQDRIPAVHIAGTKGKGSTAAVLDSILRASNIRSGLFTSPHIEVFEERMTVKGRQPEPSEVIYSVAKLQQCLETADEDLKNDPPTYFEVATLLAWMYFDRQDVELVVLETGLGGRLDCTNVCRPMVTVITNISLDHTSILGDTLEKIALEKAGIVKRDVPLVTGVTQPAVMALCRNKARSLNAPISRLRQEIHVEVRTSSRDRQVISVTTPWNRYHDLELPLLGVHQAENAALAVTAADLLSATDSRITASTIGAGVRQTSWPLRFEVIPGLPTTILDAAHNPTATHAVVRTLNDGQWLERPRVLVFGASRDKDVETMLSILLREFDHVILTQICNSPRSLLPSTLERLAVNVNGTARIQTAETSATALQLARSAAKLEGLVFVTGSVFLAGECRSLLCRTVSK